MMLVLSPVVFVRDIKKFNWTFLVGNLCIVLTVLIVSGVMIDRNVNRISPPEGIVWLNKVEYWGMVGFSCYAYEGIGVVMPVM